MENNELNPPKSKFDKRQEAINFCRAVTYLKRKGYTVESFIAAYEERKAAVDEMERLEKELEQLREKFYL